MISIFKVCRGDTSPDAHVIRSFVQAAILAMNCKPLIFFTIEDDLNSHNYLWRYLCQLFEVSGGGWSRNVLPPVAASKTGSLSVHTSWLKPNLHHWSHLDQIVSHGYLWITRLDTTYCGYYNVRAVLKNMEVLTCSFKFVWRVSGLRSVMEMLESVCWCIWGKDQNKNCHLSI
jgi:hypothetical protein